MSKPMLAALALASTVLSSQAVTITQFNFNSPTPDNATATGTTAPSIGTGTASLVGGVTATFASGDVNGGSSDPATGDDSGWNTTAYPAQSTGDKTRGTQYAVSTVGFGSIVIGYDLRHSNTSSRFEAVQYSTNGTTFVDAATFDGNAGDTWFNGRTVNLSSVAAASNNPNFAFRVLSTFAPGTGGYLASNTASAYGTTGTWRFDQVTVSGISAVPEPDTDAMLLVGVGITGFMARRRSRQG